MKKNERRAIRERKKQKKRNNVGVKKVQTTNICL